MKRNERGETKRYILETLRSNGWLDEYELREELISKYPKVFSHRTKLATIRNYHLIPLEAKGKIESMLIKGVRYYNKIPVGMEEFEVEESDTITLQ